MKRAMEQLPRETRERIERLARGGAKHEVDAIFGTNTNTVVMGDGGLAVGLFLGVAVSFLFSFLNLLWFLAVGVNWGQGTGDGAVGSKEGKAGGRGRGQRCLLGKDEASR